MHSRPALNVARKPDRDTRFGAVEIRPLDPIVAGSHVCLEIEFTAGLFGIDDTGAVRLAMRYATDMALPQFSDAAAANYVSAEASNGAKLEVRYEPRGNQRPYDRTIVIRVLSGFLRQGDTITLRLGDRRFGSPGIRFQTAAEANFQFRVAVDAIAAGVYTEISDVPTLRVVAGSASCWKAFLPTIAHAGGRAKLGFRAEDIWGNPVHLHDETLTLTWTGAVRALPLQLKTRSNRQSAVLEFDIPKHAGEHRVQVCSADGTILSTSNTMLIVDDGRPSAFWGDLHGQSEETMGLNSADAYFAFARDIAFLDITAHQGIDFQITNQFYQQLNRLTARYNVDGGFVVLPGYEWAGNTGLGGDRNVYFLEETPAIYRSSHAVVADLSDAASDVHTAAELFARLKERHAGKVMACAHVGGRYADIKLAHDGAIEKSVEIHSTWGTFEWLVHDAFDAGYRVGVVCNSDDHKGRQGAAHPGASNFGAYGGLTCIRGAKLTRPAIFAAMAARHHYGTTGARIHLDVEARFHDEVELLDQDPAIGPTTATPTRVVRMGDIVRTGLPAVEIGVLAIGTTPIERIEIRSGKSVVATFRPHIADPASRRVRITWEGAEYRGRGRQTNWDGGATVAGNTIARATAINFINPEKKFSRSDHGIVWESMTSGNAAGVDVTLDDAAAGILCFKSPHLEFTLPIAQIGSEPLVFEAGGLGRKVVVQRLPEIMQQLRATFRSPVSLNATADTPLWVCVVQEDGHRAWSSPIYAIR
jgi:hypothetical protein